MPREVEACQPLRAPRFGRRNSAVARRKLLAHWPWGPRYPGRGGEKGPVDEESGTIAFAFASVVTIKEIKRGEKITLDNIWLKRPGGGDYGAKEFNSLIGKIAQKDIPNDHQITKNDIY